MRVFKLYLDYWDYLGGVNGKLVPLMAGALSLGMMAILTFAGWIGFVAGSLPFAGVFGLGLIVPAPIHIVHLSLFLHWALTQMGDDQ